MKEYIENKWLQRVWLSVIIFAVCIGAILFTYQWQKFSQQMDILRSKEVTGIVSGFKDLGHADYYVWVNRERYFLSHFKKYIGRIQVGDSLYKPAGSMVFQLYKKTNEGFAVAGDLLIDW